MESNDGNDDKWFKAKVAIIDADQISGKGKNPDQYYLVAGRILTVRWLICISLSTYVVPFEISSLADKYYGRVPLFLG